MKLSEMSNRKVLFILGASVLGFDLFSRLILQLEALGDFASMQYIYVLQGVTISWSIALCAIFFLYARALNTLSSASTSKTRGRNKVVRKTK